jgi:hypothetical protein
MEFLLRRQRRGDEKVLGPLLGGGFPVEEDFGIGRNEDTDFRPRWQARETSRLRVRPTRLVKQTRVQVRGRAGSDRCGLHVLPFHPRIGNERN